MTRASRLFLFGVVLAGSTFGGWACSARTTAVVTQPAAGALGRFTSLALSVDSKAKGDLQKEIIDLTSAVLARVQKTTRFTDARLARAGESAAGTLLLKATVADVRKVGGATRFLAGAFAGRARMVVEVTLVDAANGRTVATHKVIGESGGTAYSGGTDDAIRKAAEGIAALLI